DTERDPLQMKYLAVVGIISLMHEKNYDEVLNIFEQIQSSGDILLYFLERRSPLTRLFSLWSDSMVSQV
ncbi:MAG: hypothetical protein P8Y08_13365, partial [Desulfobulbaceae bacterium]